MSSKVVNIKGYESRSVETKFEIRAGSDDEPTQLVGLAAVFDVLSENLGGFREIIKPGAFDKADMSDVRALFNHDPSFIMGRTVAKTLALQIVEEGLKFTADLPDTQLIRDLVVAPIERGDVTQSSFGFFVAPGGSVWDEDDEGRLIRTITEFSRIFDVSPVTFPAFPDTKVATRFLKEYEETVGEVKTATQTQQENFDRRHKLNTLGID